MPTSHLYQLNEITELIALTDPNKVLDVGIGFGKYGFLSREYLELWDGREKYGDWKRRIDGVEAHKEYLTPMHNLIYDHIYVGNAIDIVSTLEIQYDLILLIDVLEHFDYEDGMKLLEKCRNSGKNIIISTPDDIGSQKDSFDNPFETHRFQWKRKHFDKFANKFFVSNDYSLICYIGEDAFRISRIKFRMKQKIKEYFPFLKTPYKIFKKLIS